MLRVALLEVHYVGGYVRVTEGNFEGEGMDEGKGRWKRRNRKETTERWEE